MWTHSSLRLAAVAGAFYPADPRVLRRDIQAYLQPSGPGSAHIPKAMILPHAGYMYSGPIAGKGYQLLAGAEDQISHVLMLGPAHTLPLRGLATAGVSAFQTPLGDVPLDESLTQDLEQKLEQVHSIPAAHSKEHCLEVQLPFLQMVLHNFRLTPLVVGDAPPQEVAAVLEAGWGGRETLIIISSDLSHFHTYEKAHELDMQTALAIESLDSQALNYESACGRNGIRGLLECARSRNMSVERLDLRSSGDTAGSHDRVVGYGAWAFYES